MKNWNLIVNQISKNKIPPQFVKRIVLQIAGQEDLVLDLAHIDKKILNDIIAQMYADYNDDFQVVMIIDLQKLARTVTPIVNDILRCVPKKHEKQR